MTVRRVRNASLVEIPGGCLTFGLGGHVEFRSDRFTAKDRFTAVVAGRYSDLIAAQAHDPIPMVRDVLRGRTWWMFQDRFYWEEDDYSARKVKALVLAAEQRRDRRIAQAIAVTSQANAAAARGRSPIPEAVRIEVWRRDGGRCVKCGSQVNLEFDHVIPLAMGGSNTARNLQLLCETCNRSKGASLG